MSVFVFQLELSDNKLTSDLEYLKGCPNLASLKLCNNRFSDTKGLEPLVRDTMF